MLRFLALGYEITLLTIKNVIQTKMEVFMTIKQILTDKLIPYENNPRNNDGAVDAVAASIKEFGFKVPIIVDKDMVVVAGHTNQAR